jgi:aspartyl-tRNA(Asn)/glutamyl-tRNA(Gln) amidotransferase subunit C
MTPPIPRSARCRRRRGPSLTPSGGKYNRATVIDRDEVLAVARLARLRLSDDEVEPMARELSSVLDHIATIAELDLDDVPPTSHVVDVSGALRSDKPRPSWPRDVMLSQAPAVSENGFLVPSPQA